MRSSSAWAVSSTSHSPTLRANSSSSNGAPSKLLQPRKQRIAVELGRLFRLDLLGRLPLDEFALDPEQRFELRVVPFQRGELGAHAKELAYERLELWRDPQGQVGGGGAG